MTGARIAQQSRVGRRYHDGRKIFIDVVTDILRRDGTVSGQDQHHFRPWSLNEKENNEEENEWSIDLYDSI